MSKLGSGQFAIAASMVGAAILGLGGSGLAQPADAGGGYLTPASRPDGLRILPPPPAAGSGRAADDLAAFIRTRKLKGGPRWDLAANDDRQQIQPMLDDFSCALGAALTPTNAPTLARLVSRIRVDVGSVVGPPKEKYARLRPHLVRKGDICVARSDALAKSYSYPSGHSTLGWTVGLILAELAPDRSTQILMRARAIGESRVVCGVHYPSDVEAGRIGGSAVVAAVHGAAAFRADMDAARAEVAAARAAGGGPGASACAVSDAAGAEVPY